jgi:hypothetical protein
MNPEIKQDILTKISNLCDAYMTKETLCNDAINRIEAQIQERESRIIKRTNLRAVATEAFKNVLSEELKACQPLLDKYCDSHRWVGPHCYRIDYGLKLVKNYTAPYSLYIKALYHNDGELFVGWQFAGNWFAFDSKENANVLEMLECAISKAIK